MMEENADDDEFALAMQELKSAFTRLKRSHSLSEAMLVAKTVAYGVNGAKEPPVSARTPASSPHSNSTPPLSKSAKRRSRESDEAKARRDAKRADFLRARSEERTHKSAHASAHSDLGSNPSVDRTSPQPPPGYTTPTKKTVASPVHPMPDILVASTSLRHGKRGNDDRSPLKPPSTPSSAQPHAKRANGPIPKQLSYDPCIIESSDIPALQSNMTASLPNPDNARQAVCASIEASTRWRHLTGVGAELVLERVLSVLTLELQTVEKAQWKPHVHMRLGKVAGYECKLAGVWLEVPQS